MRYLNRGLYDVVEVARLVRASVDQVVRWSTPTSRRPVLVSPTLEPLFSFHDLISLHVVALLAARGLSAKTISLGIEDLVLRLDTDRPLAREEMRDNIATVGTAFFARTNADAEWLDVGRGGQGAFPSVILPALRKVEYGPDRFASIWRPADRVWLNPRIQAGASCVEPTRIPTATIRQIVESGDDPEDVAEDYELELDDVRAALRFEERLRELASVR